MQIIPSFLVDKASCTRQFESELSLHSLASLFPIKEGIFSNPSVSLSKGSSTFSLSPSSSGSGDVAGDAIALPEFWSASGACALKGWLRVLTQQSCDCLSPSGRLYGYTFLSQLLIATETYGFHHKALIILSENNLYQEICTSSNKFKISCSLRWL